VDGGAAFAGGVAGLEQLTTPANISAVAADLAALELTRDTIELYPHVQ